MRFQSSLCVLALVATSFGVAQAAPVRKIVPQGATNFTSKSQGFAVWLPQSPVQNVRLSELPSSAVITSFTSEPKLKRRSTGPQYRIQFTGPRYSVQVTPTKLGVAPWDAKISLDEMQKLIFKQNEDDIEPTIEAIQLGRTPGREIRRDGFAGFFMYRTRIYVTPQKTYQISVFEQVSNMNPGFRRQPNEAQINRVFDSFRILPQ